MTGRVLRNYLTRVFPIVRNPEFETDLMIIENRQPFSEITPGDKQLDIIIYHYNVFDTQNYQPETFLMKSQ